MNQQSLDKFLPDLSDKGILLYDSTNIKPPKTTCRAFSVEAAKIAVDIGNIRCANSAIMGAFAACLKGTEVEDYESAFEEAIKMTFRKKKELIDFNIRAFWKGKESVKMENV
jgi:Pyruvate/2-oxoacid:ferredoxin oxidoreductase gamma subunit